MIEFHPSYTDICSHPVDLVITLIITKIFVVGIIFVVKQENILLEIPHSFVLVDHEWLINHSLVNVYSGALMGGYLCH